MKAQKVDPDVRPIYQEIAVDRHEVITPATYEFKYAPRSRRRVTRAFNAALESGIIEPAGLTESGRLQYKHTKDWRELRELD